MRISDWSSDVCSSDLHSFFRDPRDGGWRIEYHRWERQDGPGPYRGHRRIAIQKVSYAADGAIEQIGRASCRERVGPYVELSVVDVSSQKKNTTHMHTHCIQLLSSQIR